MISNARTTALKPAAVTLLVLLSSSPLVAQISASTPPPAEAEKIAHGAAAEPDVEMKDPMLLEVKLAKKSGASIFVDWKPNTDRNWQQEWTIWSTGETRRFSVDRARLLRLSIAGWKTRKGETPIEVRAELTSGWFRQDIDVTLALVDADGREVAKQLWDDLTVGGARGLAYGGSSREIVLKVKVPAAAFDDFARDGRAPTVRVLVDVQDDD